MPRTPKPRAYDWVATDEDRRGPQGRPRLGPKGAAVRELGRVTIRATGRDLATFEAIREALEVPPHEAFAIVLAAWVALQDAATAGKVASRARVIRRERYADVP